MKIPRITESRLAELAVIANINTLGTEEQFRPQPPGWCGGKDGSTNFFEYCMDKLEAVLRSTNWRKKI